MSTNGGSTPPYPGYQGYRDPFARKRKTSTPEMTIDLTSEDADTSNRPDLPNDGTDLHDEVIDISHDDYDDEEAASPDMHAAKRPKLTLKGPKLTLESATEQAQKIANFLSEIHSQEDGKNEVIDKQDEMIRDQIAKLHEKDLDMIGLKSEHAKEIESLQIQVDLENQRYRDWEKVSRSEIVEKNRKIQRLSNELEAAKGSLSEAEAQISQKARSDDKSKAVVDAAIEFLYGGGGMGEKISKLEQAVKRFQEG